MNIAGCICSIFIKCKSVSEFFLLDDIEYFFVNDCSPDKSIEVLERILEEYPHRKHQVRILHHDKNKGLTSTRNTGLVAATGEYIAHCDSDDWVEPNMYETLYNKAKEEKADVVYCNFNMYSHSSTRIEEIGCFAIVLEKIPASLTARVRKEISMPIIGIGAGVEADGQVLVIQDMLGMTQMKSPKFVRKYANLDEVITNAVANYCLDVKNGKFPDENESY